MVYKVGDAVVCNCGNGDHQNHHSLFIVDKIIGNRVYLYLLNDTAATTAFTVIESPKLPKVIELSTFERQVYGL